MTYNGKHISGKGSTVWLSLIDKSFSMLHSSPTLPNLKMLYKSETDMLSEGFIWGTGWWIQNSYGFTMGAIPLLDSFWAHILQNSYDAFWERIGDGNRIGADNGKPDGQLLSLCAPDGALGDCVSEKGIVYRQGDGDFMNYDWFYEGTAACVHMQADMLLFDRRAEMLEKYIPLMRRSLNHIESTRGENGLFLVGPSANLLAPSYGGSYNAETGKVVKGYLTGISVTYAAALKKYIEVLKMAGLDSEIPEFQSRLDRTLSTLPKLMTEEGYLAKSMDPDGTLHGVYGAQKYGYLESVCNVDAIAWDVVTPDVDKSIYAKIASVHGIRPAGVICNNYPILDDTIEIYEKYHGLIKHFGFGNWVDGGCWATVEGRAILAYQKLGQYDDSFRAADWYMRWAEEYRQDAPLSQFGFNTNNPWSAENDDHTVCGRPVAIMIDNFATVTCILRGLFDYNADAYGLTIRPQIPDSITEMIQHEPIRFGNCKIYISYRSGTGAMYAMLDSTILEVSENGIIRIPADLLAGLKDAHLYIGCSGESEQTCTFKNEITLTGDIDGVPKDLIDIYNECKAALDTADGDLAVQLREILLSTEAAALRRKLPFDKHELRPMTDEKIEIIIGAYDNTVRELYKGLKYRR